MDLSFHKTYSRVIKVIASGGFYFPGSGVLYPRFNNAIMILLYVLFAALFIDFVLEAVNHFLFMTKGEAEGMTNLFMAISLGVASPTYIFILYSYTKRQTIQRIVDIWEKEMTNPPYPEDRKAEIKEIQKYFSRITKAQIYGFIIPLTIWSGRSFVTKVPILPVIDLAYTGDVTESPNIELISIFFVIFGYALAAVWCATENIKILLMRSILAELNHLYLAADKILTLSNDGEAIKRMTPAERNEELRVIKDRLRSWIIYHQTVLRFGNEVNNFTAPMLLIQEVVAVVFAFADVFLILLGSVPTNNAMSGVGYLFFYYYVLYFINNLGDEIRMKSCNIMDTFNGKEYYWFTKDIIKSVLLIQFIAAHRPINPKAKWYKSLSRKSFGELTSKGYEIIAFMSHVIKRN